MAKHRDIFVAGAEKNGCQPRRRRPRSSTSWRSSPATASTSRTRPRTRSIAYQTAYFKAHHPAAFMAANLSLVMDDTDKVRALHDDAIANGLAIVPPDVNASNYRFEPIDAQAHPLRPRRDQGHRRSGDRGDRRRSHRRRPVQRPRRFLPAHRQAHRQPPRRRSADSRRRVRFDRHATRDALRFGGRRADPRRTRRRAAAAQVSLFGEEEARRPRSRWSRRATGRSPSG